MIYIGVDIIEISRIEEAVRTWGEKFLRRVYTKREIELYGKNYSSLAARFAAKEAVIKALEAAGEGISFKDIEIIEKSGGKPDIKLHGKVKDMARDLGVIHFYISLSHSRNNAIAFVVGEKTK
jgi:holo-[acyl-carrier protein] synthase